ncbi:MAG: nucleotide sugar dehydrogenase, partial [Gammaproteobacteria bacterium]|nr:nucleotide sugar dehydrogenase [Gammaproteobacteria bacterium]
KLLIRDGYNVRDSRVIVLGLTFKENVPDLRNTRVIDIVKELQEYGVSVQVHDPLADPHEAADEYGIQLTGDGDLQPASAVILAVSHEEYMEKGWSGIQGLLDGGKGVVLDVKGCLPRTDIPDGISLWRL